MHMDTNVRLHGQLEKWPSKTKMARLMEAAGFSVYVGRYSIRLQDCEHFAFQEYGGELGDPQFDADASSLEKMLEDGRRVSAALTAADIRHRFELYNDNDELVGCGINEVNTTIKNKTWESSLRCSTPCGINEVNTSQHFYIHVMSRFVLNAFLQIHR